MSKDICQDLLAVADMLGLSDVLEVCCDFLKHQLHPSNAIGTSLFVTRVVFSQRCFLETLTDFWVCYWQLESRSEIFTFFSISLACA